MRVRPAFPRGDLVASAHLLAGLPGFLRSPVSVEAAQVGLRQRLEQRENCFLRLVRGTIYQQPASPYRALLDLVGCEYGDLERLVTQEGIEGSLRRLFRSGVYLSVEEFKGRRPVVRGSTTLAADPARLGNPAVAAQVEMHSSGSRGPARVVGIDLKFIQERAGNTCLSMDALGGGRWRKAVWGMPGGSLLPLLEYAGFGAPPVRWFAQVDPSAPGLHPRYRWSARAVRWASRLAGVPLPRLEIVEPEQPLPIVDWMVAVLRDGGTPHLFTYSSCGVRVCRAAREAGRDLHGVRLTLGGEAITAARLAIVRGTGAEALPRYGTSEAGTIGHGCLAPEAPDEVHLFDDKLALIQPATPGSPWGLPPDALLITSLRPTAPLLLLNVSLGDQAVVRQRGCGCALERLGWRTQLHTIRSFEKLTAGAMSFLDIDLVRVLEEVLPARFGGAPTDYQLVEGDASDGRAGVRLLVHPRLGPLDPGEVQEAFLGAIGGGSGAKRLKALRWRRADLPSIERRPPLSTESGKILHLHQQRRPAATVSGR